MPITVKGTWIFNETLTDPMEEMTALNFTVDGIPCWGIAGILFGSNGADYALVYKTYSFGEVTVYDSNGWRDEKYRTIDLGKTEQEITNEYLYNWFIANAHEYACYSIDSETMIGIADAIREKLNIDTKYTPLEMPAGINAVYDAGKAAGGGGYTQEELDKAVADATEQGYDNGFTDGEASVVPLERYASMIRFASMDMFGKPDVVLNLDCATTLVDLFRDAPNNTVEHLTINCPDSVQSISGFRYVTDSTLKRLTYNFDTKNTKSFIQAFRGCVALEIIDGTPLDLSNASNETSITNPFMSCVSLVDVRFVANSIYFNFSVAPCPNLSGETIQSIVDGLADLTGQTAQTITFHKDVGPKLTETQKATITAKNWTLVY